MAKKKPAEEHENLERYLVSYSDFMTLLFATFVVLYALAQSDVNSFKGIEEALKKAFTQNIFENSTNLMNGSDSFFEGEEGATNPLMLEYVSQKYEQNSFDEIEREVEALGTEGVSAEKDERGLVIRLDTYAVSYAAGTADLTPESIDVLNKVARIIKEKFAIHYIRVEGHSDSDVISSPKFPTNWELSAARACSVVRYLIDVRGFNPKLFTAVGMSDTVPLVPNTSLQNKMRNRRVEIIILKNQNKSLSKKNMSEIMKEVQASKDASGRIKGVEGIVGNDKELLKNVIDMSDQYETESKRLDSLQNDEFVTDGQKPDFLD